MDGLINVSIKIGINENWSKDHTYTYYGGFIMYRSGDTLYAVKESTAVTKLLEYNGFSKNENALGQMINHEDYGRYLMKEGPEGPNVRKLSAFLLDKDFRDEWQKLTTREELEDKINELLQHSPYFRPKDDSFLNTHWGQFAAEQYDLEKQENISHKR